jgi:hypothetical protein
MCSHHPLFRDLNSGFRQAGLDRLIPWLQKLEGRKKRPEAEIYFLARTIQVLAFGYFIESLITNPNPALPHLKVAAVRAVFDYLDSMIN